MSRANDYLVISDVKSAFLMIKLKHDAYKRKFSILWKDSEGNLIGYKYNSIVFGFSSSPFILNNIIKFHASKFPEDECTKILKNNVYVDNVFFSGNTVDELLELYNTSVERMESGGFILRSWASNSAVLKDKFDEDGSGSSHGTPVEKLLGYEYDTSTDTMSVPVHEVADIDALTKRKLLSVISQVFDPLGLYLPVTITGKIILREVWSLKFDWDSPLNEEIVSKFSKFHSDLKSLSQISFDRKAYKGKISLKVITLSV